MIASQVYIVRATFSSLRIVVVTLDAARAAHAFLALLCFAEVHSNCGRQLLVARYGLK